MQFVERLPIEANVRLIGLDKHGNVIFRDDSHNVFTNMGRNWMAESNRVLAGGGRKVDVLPYYLAVGQGSDQQSITPPGPGTQAESALVEYIENPVLISGSDYLVELDRPTVEPDDYTNQYTYTIQTTEVSFGANPSVPLTEFALVTSNAITTLPGGKKTVGGGPYSGTYDNGYLIAYRAIPPITKTGLFSLQVIWELRY